MTKKEKEEERIEKIIRGLLKLPENRRCINCNSLGPQYVCTTFFTFVCTSCSGIHREFTHRVKSVSMAKFNAEEVSSLQAGGNERARQIYLKEWDPQRNKQPDSSNLQKLRDFIKHVYVDRRYTGEKSNEKLPRLRLVLVAVMQTDKEEYSESRRVVLYSGGTRSPNYEDRHGRSERSGFSGRTDDKTFKYYYDERRSPRYSQENSRYGGFKRSPTRFEVVDDRFRDDGMRIGRQSDVHPFAHRESRFGNSSSDIQKNKHQSGSNAPVVCHLKDILGENLLPLQVGEQSKALNGKDSDGSVHSQSILVRTEMPTSSSSMASADGNPVQQKSHNSENLVDLNANSKSSVTAAAPPAQENLPSSEGGNCSSQESFGKENIPPAPKPNILEFLLMELSVPSVTPADNTSEIPTNDNPSSAVSGEDILTSSVASAAGPSGQMLALPSSDVASATASGGSMPADGISSAVPVAQMSTLTDSTGASTTASGGNMSAASVSHGEPVEKMLALPRSAGASTAVSGGTMPVGRVSPAAYVVQPSTSSGISLPAGDSLPSIAVEETLKLVDAFDASTIPSNTSLPAQPSNGVPTQTALDNSGDSTFEVLDGQQISTMQQQRSSTLPADSGSTGQWTANTPAGAVNDQATSDDHFPDPLFNEMMTPTLAKILLTSSNVPSAQGPPDFLGEYPSQSVSKPAQESNSEAKSQHLPSETNSSGRKELPMVVALLYMDLFSGTYSPPPGPIPGWQICPPYGTGFNMQHYRNAMLVPAYPNPAKSTNPFDLNGDTTSAQAPPFPSMGNLHGALPMHTSAMPPQSLSFASAMPYGKFTSVYLQYLPISDPHLELIFNCYILGGYVGQQAYMNLPHSRPQGPGNFGIEGVPFGSLNMAQQPTSGHLLPTFPSSHPSKGGNPFG
ncbi:unnamed protein product [Dovyalis caffra]|uniref:Arf-GAP domain-containing protein n=1 Tax=Dovyalis caffra TaxID=77055 RepID=A0AAV1SP13_9ROSI|nr:unnamed protein product [Dovyalis caffra]